MLDAQYVEDYRIIGTPYESISALVSLSLHYLFALRLPFVPTMSRRTGTMKTTM